MTRIIKRLIDITASLVGLVVLAPVFAVLVLAIRLTMGPPVLFRQTRPGLHDKPFVMYKFRTMHELRDKKNNLLPDDKRITLIGRTLRKTSLDEVLELFNVLKGDMSLVGPRPLLVEYLDRYTPQQMRRHEVRPGITGWAQVNGRNAISWEEKFKYDVWYVDNWSLWLDLKIITMTVWKVFKGEGISQEGHATMEEYRGNIENE